MIICFVDIKRQLCGQRVVNNLTTQMDRVRQLFETKVLGGLKTILKTAKVRVAMVFKDKIDR